MGSRMSSPSFIGVRPRFASRSAFSTSLSRPFSQGFTVISRGSGTARLATPVSGVGVP